MKVEDLPLASITPYPGNPRQNEAAVASVKKSLDQFGWRQPIVVDKDRVIVVGHTRYEAAKLRKDKTVPVHIAYELTEDQARAYRLVDNKTAELADWDQDAFDEEMGALLDENFDMTGFGFSNEELQLLEEEAEKVENRWLEDYDATPEAKPQWVLMKINEDDAAPLVAELRARNYESCIIQYSAEAPESKGATKTKAKKSKSKSAGH